MLHLQGGVAVGDEVAHDEAGGEGPQHDVEVEQGRDGREPDEHQVHRAHEHLGVGVGVFHHEAVDPAAQPLGPLRHGGSEQGDGDEGHEDEHGLPLRSGGQEQGHGQHRQKLAPGAVGQDLASDARVHELALLQNGQQGAQSGGGERDGHGHAVHGEQREGGPRCHDDGRDGEGDGPGGRPALALGAGEVLGADLVAGQKEQEGQAQIGQKRRGVGYLHDVQHVGAAQGAGRQQEHRFRYCLVGDEAAEDGAEKRDERDEGEGYEVGYHRGSFSECDHWPYDTPSVALQRGRPPIGDRTILCQ